MSLVALPKRHCAGDMPVPGLGPFLYCRRAWWKSSDRVPPGPVLPAISLLVVFTAVSARQLAWGL